MPQETNLNVAPYFDDFDRSDKYFKVLFKPGFPVQARELTGIQSILQDQIEKFGSHAFKEGSSVTGGGVKFTNAYTSILIQSSNEGFDVKSYLFNIKGRTVIGSQSGIKAKIIGYLPNISEDGTYTLFVNYLNSGANNSDQFISGESLLLDGESFVTKNGITFQVGEPIAQLHTGSCNYIGCAAVLSSGIYFARGFFIDVKKQTLIINPYTSDVNVKVGLRVYEDIINSDINSSLNDNAAGFSNFTAPGADRLRIELRLEAVPIAEDKSPNFIEIMEIRNGKVASVIDKVQYNDLSTEFARRTFDESGNYYVKPYTITARNTLNNFEGNNGVFTSDQVTYNNNTPSDDLGTYRISPGKAYIRGYEVETVVPGFLDFKKPRTTKLLEDQSINYVTGPTFTLNRVSGSPSIGIGTDYTVSLRDERVGAAATTASGKEIGLARVYDFALESGSYNVDNTDLNEWDISLYDIQPYTEIALNNPTTLTVPTHIKGKSSGATGFLRYGVTSSTAVTAYNTKGNFVAGEQFIFNGEESGVISVATTAYRTSDVKSVHGTVSTASTFNADVKQSDLVSIGQVKITDPPTSGASAGISTVTFTDPNKFFIGIATVGNIVEYTNSGLNTTSYARIESVSQRSLTISGVTTVTGICEGGLPSTAINPADFKVLTSQFQSSTDNTLFTPLSKRNIASVDLTNSHITIRKQYDVNITNNSTGAVSSGDASETFLPYDEERYVLIRTDGTTESLSADKFEFNSGSTEVTINGLGANSAAKLIATLRKVNVKEKVKQKQKINQVSVVNSNNSSSGVGATTLNDGLTFSAVYGTRVQDEEISLGVPDATLVYGVFESFDSSAPVLPRVSLTSINSATGKTGDLLIGDTFQAATSNFKGVYVSKFDDSTINYIALNDFTLQTNEDITFKESGISATTDSLVIGSNNITDEFNYDDGQRDTIYDYSRITRKPGFNAPSRRLLVVFESAFFAASDTGDITTANSYDNFNYAKLPQINNSRVSDIIDIRPRVSEFSGTSYSPFEFLGRAFTASGNSAKNILASDESILLDYAFYLPRLDRIYLNDKGEFQLVNGIPAETPELPNAIDGALEVASISLPAFLYNVTDVSINLAEYKRYQMRDINRLEQRIESLEFYTSLSLLERDTLNMQVTDADGLNRFKSGFFVDDFSDTENQIKKTIVKNSIDYQKGELRPAPYTTELDLKLDLNSSNGIRKTGRVLSLDYDTVPFVHQPFATRTESVTPFLINYYGGVMNLTPSSDVWLDQVTIEAKKEDLTTYTETSEQVAAGGFDPDTGYSPVTWGAWETTWTGGGGLVSESSDESWSSWHSINQDTNQREKTRTTTQTFTSESSTQQRVGTRSIVRETFSTINEGPKVVNTDLAPFMRSRNIEFSASSLKPTTNVFGFFDGENVNKFIIPKLLQISMVTGTFQVGETVIGTTADGTELIRFRVAKSNHKLGDFDNPAVIYNTNPYFTQTPLAIGELGGNRTRIIDTITPEVGLFNSRAEEVNIEATDTNLLSVPAEYSTTSTLINIDTLSLADKSENTFFGYVEKNLKLVGQTSSAQATVSEINLKTDNIGYVRGSFFIPDPNDITTPKFECGKKIFRLSSSPTNSQAPGNVKTDCSSTFEATGNIDTLQSTIISVRNINTHTQQQIETQTIGGDSYTVSSTEIVGTENEVIGYPDQWHNDIPVVKQPDGTEITGLYEVSDTTGAIEIKGNVVANEYGTDTVINEQTIEEQNLLVSDFNTFRDTDWVEEQGSVHSSGTMRAVAQEDDPDIIEQAYLDLLGRQPDGPGYDYWKEDIQNNPETAAAFAVIGSVENSEGAGNLAGISAANTITNYLAKQFGVSLEGQDKAAGTYTNTFDTYGNDAYWICENKTDPLAQSFFVENTHGVFITQADIFIASKDDTLPLIVQLRTVKLGIPTEEVIPFGEVVLQPGYVNTSDNASIPTSVVFPSPVYLSPGETYCIVLMSVSPNYHAWISRMGEIDIQTVNNPEAEQVQVSSQPTLGSLFKSQNGQTWNPSQFEDLKFNLWRAQFNKKTGNINFHNPSLLPASDDIHPLRKDSLQISSNKIRIGFNTTISDTGINLGNTVLQLGSNATGNYVGSAGTATGNLTITNAGFGYTPSSGSQVYSNVALNAITGTGKNGTANITISNGVAVAATIASGGIGYSLGDVVGISSVGINSLGSGIQFSITTLTGTNEFVLDNVQGEFATGVGKTFQYINSSGVTTTLNFSAGGNVFLSATPETVTDGVHVKVNQKNHGMHSTQNIVTLENIKTDVPATELASAYDSTSTGSLVLNDGTNFAQFENVGVGSTNLGFVKVGSEILSYSGVSGNTLTGVTRGVDSSQTLTHASGDLVHKYELNGVSLRRINTNHNLSNVTISDPIGLDHYNIKVDMSTNGVDRSVGTSLPILHFNDTKSTGGENSLSSENMPFEIVRPIVQNITPTTTNVTSQIRTVSGSSINGSEASFVDQGFEDISLTTNNYMSSPRIIASRINETTLLSDLPDNRSFTMNLSLESGSPFVSPIIDLDRVAVILTSNRLNQPITNYVTDNRINNLLDDPNSFVYATKPITLENGATSIKIHLEAHVNVTSDIRAFYAVTDDPNGDLVYQPFPGFNNLFNTGQVIDPYNSNGLPDKLVPKTDVIAYTSNQVVYNDYEFTIDNLPTFRNFSIKLVGTGTNQAQPPRMRNLRVLALA